METLTSTVLALARLATLTAAISSRQKRSVFAASLAAIYLTPTLCRNHQLHGPLVRKLTANSSEVWLTIDDGPLRSSTPSLLTLLKEYDAQASFFVVGHRVTAQRELAREIISEGHSLENHTYSHPIATWWALPTPLLRREIQFGTHAIQTACGYKPRFFRSPVGMTNPWVPSVLKEENLVQVGWSVNAMDACQISPSKVIARVLSRVQPGSILLLHDGQHGRHRSQILRGVLEGLRGKGLRCRVPKAGGQQA